MYKNTANSHTVMGNLTQHTVTPRYPKVSLADKILKLQKQQWYYIHINHINPTLARESLQHFWLHSCGKKTRTEDQLHCVSLTTPFRGTVTVLEVVTPTPLVSKKSLFERCSVKGRGPRKSVDFPNAQEIAGFHTSRGYQFIGVSLSLSLNLTDRQKS